MVEHKNIIKSDKRISRGLRNNNPLNIKKGSKWKGERPLQTDAVFEEFISMDYGARAGLYLIRKYINVYRCNTPAAIISKWAPTSENATANYIEYVCKKTSLKPNLPIRWAEKNKVCLLAWAMAWMECGCETSFGLWENAYSKLVGETDL